MESLESLKQRRQRLVDKLKTITIKKHSSVSWKPGVQDQYNSESFDYEEYTDKGKAYSLKKEIATLDEYIRTYAERVEIERQRIEAQIESSIPKYSYVSGGKEKTTKNPAIAARYDAQHRLFGKSKLEQALITLTGQKRKFKRLWIKANTQSSKTQEQVALELNKLFR